ncbi:MAG: hypothetical protein RR436_00445 [Clostridia bacterium]
MKKTINKKTYNTETATEEASLYFGNFGDDNGFEERLFKNKTGEYFFYGVGGKNSKYPEPTIAVATEKAAKAFITANK